MKIELSKNECEGILKMMWLSIKSNESNDSFAEFYVMIKHKLIDTKNKDKK